jgi:hypothetical protein
MDFALYVAKCILWHTHNIKTAKKGRKKKRGKKEKKKECINHTFCTAR